MLGLVRRLETEAEAISDRGAEVTAYEVLGVREDATEAEIREAFRRLALEHHPDHGGDAERFRLVTRAHALISDPGARRAYNQRLALLRAKAARAQQTEEHGGRLDVIRRGGPDAARVVADLLHGLGVLTDRGARAAHRVIDGIEKGQERRARR